MDRRRFLVFAPALASALAATAAPPAQLPLATDLQADGRASRRRRVPIVILFSLPGCPYCEIVRRSHLLPMLRDPKESARAIIRQVDIDSDQAVVGFGGAPTTHEAIARAHGVRSVPVVAFWDGEGRPLADPLKGMLLPDFYSAYLESALESARTRLAARG
jgi:thioredoxin-related protein